MYGCISRLGTLERNLNTLIAFLQWISALIVIRLSIDYDREYGSFRITVAEYWNYYRKTGAVDGVGSSGGGGAATGGGVAAAATAAAARPSNVKRYGRIWYLPALVISGHGECRTRHIRAALWLYLHGIVVDANFCVVESEKKCIDPALTYLQSLQIRCACAGYIT